MIERVRGLRNRSYVLILYFNFSLYRSSIVSFCSLRSTLRYMKWATWPFILLMTAESWPSMTIQAIYIVSSGTKRWSNLVNLLFRVKIYSKNRRIRNLIKYISNLNLNYLLKITLNFLKFSSKLNLNLTYKFKILIPY